MKQKGALQQLSSQFKRPLLGLNLKFSFKGFSRIFIPCILFAES